MGRGEAYEWLYEVDSDYEKMHFEHIAEDSYFYCCAECEI